MGFFKKEIRKCSTCPECDAEGFVIQEVKEFLESDKRKTSKIKGNWRIHYFECSNCGTKWSGHIFNAKYQDKNIINLLKE